MCAKDTANITKHAQADMIFGTIGTTNGRVEILSIAFKCFKLRQNILYNILTNIISAHKVNPHTNVAVCLFWNFNFPLFSFFFILFAEGGAHRSCFLPS